MEPEVELKHSGMGIASFVISVAVIVLMGAVFLAAGLMYDERVEEATPAQMMIGLLTIFLVLVDVVAVGLGIAALTARNRKKVFGVLGLCFSSLTILMTIGIIVIGLRME